MCLIVCLTFPLATVAPATAADSGSSAIVGTWRLVAIEGVGRGSTPGDQPFGIVTYDTTGHVAVQMAYRSRRPPFAAGADHATDPEKAAAYDSYGAYFGTYTVDALRGTITHHIEGSLNPNDVGTELVRFFELRGDTVIYYVAEDGRGARYQTKGGTVRRIVWQRVEPR